MPLVDAADETKTSPCEAGARDCADGGVVRCVDGTWVAEERCENDRPHCAAGRCIECLRGEVTCRLRTVLRCDESGTFQATSTCGGKLPVCHDGRCVECEPGAGGTCNDRQPIQCLADGFYAPQATCLEKTRCYLGSCVTDAPPLVNILEPATGSTFRIAGAGDRSVEILVRAVATDAEDGALTSARLVWTTDRIDIQPDTAMLLNLGNEAPVSLYVPNPCRDTTHQLRVTAVDTAFNRVSAEVTVTIACPISP